jgi:proline iminopeptidase
MMKTYLLLVLSTLAYYGCNNAPAEMKTNAVPVSEYFTYTKEETENAGVKMVPIETPKGTFKVWTKKIGNNPRIKVLLLHGGPALTHEYM